MDLNVPIAVIGMSCRFPGDVRNPEDLWQLCANGRSRYSEIPLSRFNRDSVYHPNPEKVDSVRIDQYFVSLKSHKTWHTDGVGCSQT